MRSGVIALFSGLLLSALLLGGCEEKIFSDSSSERVRIQLAPRMTSSTLQALVATYRLTISASDMDAIVAPLVWADGFVVGVVENVPAGPERTFTLECFDENGALIYRGVTIAAVEAGQTVDVGIDLLPIPPLIRISPPFARFSGGGSSTDFVDLTIKIDNTPDITFLTFAVKYDPNALIPIGFSPDSGLVGVLSTFSIGSGFISSSFFSSSGVVVDSSGHQNLAVFRFRQISSQDLPDSTLVEIDSVFASIVETEVSGIFTDLAIIELTPSTDTTTNQAPVWSPQADTTIVEGDTLFLNLSASDPEFTSLTLSASGLPTNSSFLDSGEDDGSFTFAPDFTQADVYQVSFVASDGELDATLNVQITVLDFDRPPTLNPIGGPFVIPVDSLIGLQVSASDPDSAVIPTISAAPLPAGATFDKNFFAWTPKPGQEGVYDVTFTATDGGGSDSETVRITVFNDNGPPVIDSIGPFIVAEGDSLGFEVNASDPDVDAVSFRAVNLPPNSSFIDVQDNLGRFSFKPDFTQAGQYTVRFIASDGLLEDTLDVSITVTDVNQAPTFDADPGSFTIAEAFRLEFTVSASDPDGTDPSVSAIGVPPGAFLEDDGGGVGIFVFLPSFDQAGVYSITFIASDGKLADSLNVSISVTNVNRAPVIVPIDSQFVIEGKGVFLNIFANDPDGDKVQYAIDTAAMPANSFFGPDEVRGYFFDFDPDFSQSGTYDIRFFASDGFLVDTELVTIIVRDTTRAPVINPSGPFVVAEGDTLVFEVSGTDADFDALTFRAENLPANASFVDLLDNLGRFNFTPDFTQAGQYSVTFIASDGLLEGSLVVLITVTDVNQAPLIDPIESQFMSEGDIIMLNVLGRDPDGDQLQYSVVNPPANSSFLASDGPGYTFEYEPDFTAAGIYNVLFIVSDGLLDDTETVTITVTDVNRAPVLDSIGPKFVTELDFLGFVVFGSDPDGGSVAVSAFNLPNGAVFEIVEVEFEFGWIPDLTQAGTYSVGFVASDGKLADTEFVSITVNNVNQAPQINPLDTQIVAEGGNLQLGVDGSDPDFDQITFRAENLPINATFVDFNEDGGTFNFSPDFDQAGTYFVKFIATDGFLEDTLDLVIVVTNTNRAPKLDPIPNLFAAAGDAFTINFSASDPDQDSMTLSVLNVPPNTFIEDDGNGSGQFGFDPTFSDIGVYSAIFVVSDGSQADSITVRLEVVDPCGVALFAFFDQDPLDAPPDVTLPGIPFGDFLTLPASTSGDVKVQGIGNFESNGCVISDSKGQTALIAHLAPARTCGAQEVSWRGFISNTESLVLCELIGSQGELISSLEFLPGGEIRLNGVAGSVSVPYSANLEQDPTLLIDFNRQTVTLLINGNQASNSLGFVQFASQMSTVQFIVLDNSSTGITEFTFDEFEAVGQQAFIGE